MKKVIITLLLFVALLNAALVEAKPKGRKGGQSGQSGQKKVQKDSRENDESKLRGSFGQTTKQHHRHNETTQHRHHKGNATSRRHHHGNTTRKTGKSQYDSKKPHEHGEKSSDHESGREKQRGSKPRGMGPGSAVDYTQAGPHAAPLRGAIGTVDNPIAADRTQIYGPFEAGFSEQQVSQIFDCSGVSVIGGLDTQTAEKIIEHRCNKQVSLLDECGGHARPYHYHEKMQCLYSSDQTTGHSTRIGTALDGHGIYGKHIDGGVEPTDLDACGGRFGVTPDSNGKEVYYYVVREDRAPFTLSCFGPVASVQECRDLYPTCGDDDEIMVTTAEGSFPYDPDCPCFDDSGSNVGSSAASHTRTATPTDTAREPELEGRRRRPDDTSSEASKSELQGDTDADNKDKQKHSDSESSPLASMVAIGCVCLILGLVVGSAFMWRRRSTARRRVNIVAPGVLPIVTPVKGVEAGSGDLKMAKNAAFSAPYAVEVVQLPL